jgi:hypothetical protein
MDALFKTIINIVGIIVRLYITMVFAVLAILGKALVRIISDLYHLFLVRRAAGGRTARRAPGRSSSRRFQDRSARRQRHP